MRIRLSIFSLTVALALVVIAPTGALATGPTYAPAPPPAKAAAPRITVKPPRSTTNPLAKFAFSGAGAHECKLDAKAWKRCGVKYQVRVAVGSHKLQVRTAETAAKLASKPTVYAWRVLALKGKH